MSRSPDDVPDGSRVVTLGAVDFADFGSPPMPTLTVRRALPPSDWKDVDWLVVHTYPIPWSSATPPPIPATSQRVAVFSPYDGPTNAPVLEPLDAFYLPLARFAGFARPGPYIYQRVTNRDATAPLAPATRRCTSATLVLERNPRYDRAARCSIHDARRGAGPSSQSRSR